MEAPAWARLKGGKRIAAEFKSFSKSSANGNSCAYDFEMIGDSLYKWRFKLRNFDDDIPGGKDLNADLAQLKRHHGMDHLLMEIQFPQDYPAQPFFLRVVKPRCMWYSGHVTAGGSICIEALALSGTEGGWRSEYCVESILQVVITNMVDCERVFVQTATGPGGMSGPLRIDLQGRYSPTMMEYSDAEARAAFARMQSHHAAHGWGNGGDGEGAGAGRAGGPGAPGHSLGALHRRLFGGGSSGSGGGCAQQRGGFGGSGGGLGGSGAGWGGSSGGVPGLAAPPPPPLAGRRFFLPPHLAAPSGTGTGQGHDGSSSPPHPGGSGQGLPSSVLLPGASARTMKRLGSLLAHRRGSCGSGSAGDEAAGDVDGDGDGSGAGDGNAGNHSSHGRSSRSRSAAGRDGSASGGVPRLGSIAGGWGASNAANRASAAGGSRDRSGAAGSRSATAAAGSGSGGHAQSPPGAPPAGPRRSRRLSRGGTAHSSDEDELLSIVDEGSDDGLLDLTAHAAPGAYTTRAAQHAPAGGSRFGAPAPAPAAAAGPGAAAGPAAAAAAAGTAGAATADPVGIARGVARKRSRASAAVADLSAVPGTPPSNSKARKRVHFTAADDDGNDGRKAATAPPPAVNGRGASTGRGSSVTRGPVAAARLAKQARAVLIPPAGARPAKAPQSTAAEIAAAPLVDLTLSSQEEEQEDEGEALVRPLAVRGGANRSSNVAKAGTSAAGVAGTDSGAADGADNAAAADGAAADADDADMGAGGSGNVDAAAPAAAAKGKRPATTGVDVGGGASGSGAGEARSPVPKLRKLLVALGADAGTVDELIQDGLAPEALGAAVGVPDIQELLSSDEEDAPATATNADNSGVIQLMDATPRQGASPRGGRAKKRAKRNGAGDDGSGPSGAAEAMMLDVQEVPGAALQDGKLANALATIEAMRKQHEALKQRCSNLEKVAAAPVEGAFRAPLPAHWEAMSPVEETAVKLVELPLPASLGESQEQANEEVVDPEHLEEMTSNGIPRSDAIAALAHAQDDLDKAYEFHFASVDRGGAAAVLWAKRSKRRGAPSAHAAALSEGERAMQAEAERVLAAFYKTMGGGGRAQHHVGMYGAPGVRAVVKRIERVQNWRLLSKFEFKTSEVAELCGGTARLNQEELWHGSGRLDNILAICRTGFDHRLSNLNGALGGGTYFAKDASYSDAYAKNGAGGAAAAAAAIGKGAGGGFNGAAAMGFMGPWSAAGGWGGMPPPPPLAGFSGMFGAAHAAAPVAAAAIAAAAASGGGGGGRVKRGRQSSVGASVKARLQALQAQAGRAVARVTAATGVGRDGEGHTWAGKYAMLLCKVTLGRIARGSPGLRRPPEGYDSVSSSGGATLEPTGICSVFDNAQAYPMYIIHYN